MSKALARLDVGTEDGIVRYALALNELTDVQKRAILSSDELSAAQRRNILAYSERLKSIKQVTVAEYASMMNTDKNTLETETNTLAKAMNAKATDTVTVAMLEQAVQAGVLSADQVKLIMTTQTLDTVNRKTATGFKTLGASMKASMITMVTTPTGWITLATTVLPLLISGFKNLWDYMNITYDELKEDATEAVSRYTETKNAVEEVNGELRTTQDRMYELRALASDGKITLAEQEELDILERKNIELERELRIKKEIEALAAKDANDALVRQFSDITIDQGGLPDEARKDLMDRHEEIVEKYDDLFTRYSQYDNAITEDMGDRFYSHLADIGLTKEEWDLVHELQAEMREINELLDFDAPELSLEDAIVEYEKILSLGDDATKEQKSRMESMREQMLGYANDVSAALSSYVGEDEGYDYLKGLADALDKVLYPAEHFKDVFGSLPSVVQEAMYEAGASGNVTVETVEKLASDYPELAAAMQNAGYSAEDVASHFNALSASTDASAGAATKYVASLKPLSEIMKDVKGVADVVSKAQSEMVDSGHVSTETIESLAEITDDYTQYLVVEEGQIRLNISALNALAQAKQEAQLDEIRNSIATYEQENALIREQIKLIHKDIEESGMTEDSRAELERLISTIYENNTAIEENQELLELWEAIFEGATEEISGLARAEELLTKSTETVSSTISDLAGTIGDINDTISEYKDKTNLTEREMLDLIAKFPSLISSLKKTEDGYELNVEALEDLRDAEIAEAKAMVEAERTKAWTILTSTNQITESLGVQINAFTTAAGIMSAYASAAATAAGANADIPLLDEDGQIVLGKNAAATKKELDGLNAVMSSLPDYAAVQKQAQAIENLNNLLKQIDTTDWGGITGSSGGGSKIEDYVADIDEFREALRRLNETQERAEDISRRISNSDDLQEQVGLQKILIHAYGQEREALQSLITLRTQSITAGVQSLREMGFAVEYNAKTHDLWISNLEHLNNLTATSIGEYSSMQEATNALRQDTEDLINSLTDLNDENKSGTGEWEDLEASIRDAREEIYGLLEDIVANASASVDSIQEVYDTLHNAADEYAQSGYITVDTLQSIIALGPKYMSLLENENGQLVINEDNIRKVIAARTEQLGIESAMAYVQSLRVAAEADDITTLNNLIYATNDATDATWGLVYANLKLLEIEGKLTGAQYTQALDNINAMRALAENAAANVGRAYDEVSEGSAAEKLVDELNEMKSGIDDIMQYVMDMIRHQVEADIEALEDLKDGYSDIIDLKKESLEASKEEADYQKDMASKIKEIAKLQSQIDALALDDSREAQAKRLSLMEDMAELQEDLNETQADSALDKTLESLDKQEEAYHEEKDREIEKLEETISSQQKLYDMAIDHIKNNWGSLLDELRAWNYEYGSSLTSEIESAWDAALAAAQRYGSFVEAMGAIDADIEAAQNAANSSGSSGGMNTTIGKSEDYDGPSDADMIKEIVSKMRMKSSMWSKSNTEEENLALHGEVTFLANELAKYGVGADYDAPTGEWRIVYDRHNPNNVGKLLYSVYHTGGVVGGGDIKANEQLALLKKNEWVLSETMVKNLVAQMDRIEILSRALSETQSSYGRMLSTLQMGTTSPSMVSNIVNNNNRPVEVTFGDTIIHGADRTSVERHVQISREMVNDLARIIGVRK